ncbi:uncharacterized protein dlgap2a isoform X1 [Pungitius pungitius]|uniref:uncharacterized protein dlgap2a isoform X1 n=1 Tax=Pungitius pungitius TaxID=134920 RepID=UPI002E115DB5
MRNYITNFAADLSQSYHLQAARDMHPSIALDPSANYNSPKFRSRNQSYMRAVSTLSQASCVSQVSQVSETEMNGQFESVCESVFSEVESQAMEALDLPGCFRTRSHSYLRAIQAGYSQDDDCIPPMGSTVTSTIRATTDRNYVREDSCLPDQASVLEDLAGAAPLAHDDLGCPIRRDRLYQQDNMGATAKPLSGPPVSPSLFRCPRSNAPSPKAIKASIKESATLAAAISMQWKEEVSAMRRELADLRRDLCVELRAFNSNFNTFTQHYNTWSPQGGNLAAGAGRGFGGRVGAGTGTAPRAGAGLGEGVGGLGTSTADGGTGCTGGAREKKPQISKVSVGTQSRSKVLVRQSTADAAVNCPEEKEEKKGARRNLPKQLSMDPSILAFPQSMYVESAIPLSLGPILPGSVRAAEPETIDLTAVPSKAKPEKKLELTDDATVGSSGTVVNEPVATHGTVPVTPEAALECPPYSVTLEQEVIVTPQLISTGPANDSYSDIEPSHLDYMRSTDSDLIEKGRIQLPNPVPVVIVSPPEEHDDEIMSDSEPLDPIPVEKHDLVSQDPAAVSLPYSGLDDTDPADPTELESKPSDLAIVPSPDPVSQGPFSLSDIPTLDLVTAPSCNLETDIICPSIVVSEYLDNDSPTSLTESDTDPDPIITFPDYHPDSPSEQMASATAFTFVETQPNTDPEPEWPPLPEPLDTTPIYHADLVHFDLVMLTSLDQDDLDSVFMDPEPDPFDLSVDYPSITEDFFYQSHCSSSPLPTVDPATVCPLDPSLSTEPVRLGPAVEHRLAHTLQEVASELQENPQPKVTVTISPPSSVSPDTSLEMDFGPTSPVPDPLEPDTDSAPPDLEDIPSVDLAPKDPENKIAETLECISESQEYGEPLEIKGAGSPETSSSEQAFLWCRWQKRGQKLEMMHRSASVELWSGRYEYNSAEISYVSLTL